MLTQKTIKKQTKKPSKELFKNILEYILENVNKAKRLDDIKELMSTFWTGTAAIKKRVSLILRDTYNFYGEIL